MKNQMSDGALRVFLKSFPPMEALDESGDWLGFPDNPLGIHKRDARYNTGWTAALTPGAHFLRRWFEFPELNRRGWAIIFRLYAADESGPDPIEFFGGWVLPEQEADADQWIARLNTEIRARLAATADGAAGPKPGGGTKTALRLVGNFREMGYATPDAPSLVDERGKRGPDHKADVLAYLRAGESVSLSPGPAPDFFDPSKSAGHKSHSLYTDGVHVWPAFLAYYLEHYDVALPADFEEFMRRRQWRIPATIDLASVKLPWQ